MGLRPGAAPIGGKMLTPEKILSKNYTPRDLWQAIERITALERAIFAHRESEAGRSQRDRELWRALDNLPVILAIFGHAWYY